MKGERSGHSLQMTWLINEAYIGLFDYRHMQRQDRAHFFAISAQLTRRVGSWGVRDMKVGDQAALSSQ